MESLSLEEKVGQMIIGGFDGYQLSSELITLIEDYKIGGIAYYRRNIDNNEQLFSLSKAMQERAIEKVGIPLLISIDQEGGVVGRITDDFTLIPGNMALGAVGNLDLVYDSAAICAKELKALGINMNLAPCLDINSNPNNCVIGVRSFSDEPLKVSELGIAVINGYQNNDLCATIKHFPGHGDTESDSHYSMPIITQGIDLLYDRELLPFIKAIEAGVDAIMTGHILVPELDKNYPCTVSKIIITDLLRNKLGYEGVVVSDCLEMKGISSAYEFNDLVIKTVQAGVDLLFFAHGFENKIEAINCIIQAVKNGIIPIEQIDASVQRILDLKKKRNLESFIGNWEEAKKEIAKKEHTEFLLSLSEQSITLVKDENNKIPLNTNREVLVINLEVRTDTEIDIVFHLEETLGYYLKKYGCSVNELSYSIDPSEEDIEEILSFTTQYQNIIVTSYNTVKYENQRKLIKRLENLYKDNLIILAVRNPYDILMFEEIKTYILSYESNPVSMDSAAKVLLGKSIAKGNLPVKIY
ncbi:glycoside hydrolase family 3 protein [Paenibacillus sp. GSMTC-2017]|uniref:glycoside hydrolase family 3 protein n=1 Tax=Paenibacillus sp. GSMTC-2017 TaxID=2794350 RepID=UPI0018D6BC54|nr:glycoside hydrolase family 3 protein [Paenibacillus sp. GSMTC-2017]